MTIIKVWPWKVNLDRKVSRHSFKLNASFLTKLFISAGSIATILQLHTHPAEICQIVRWQLEELIANQTNDTAQESSKMDESASADQDIKKQRKRQRNKELIPDNQPVKSRKLSANETFSKSAASTEESPSAELKNLLDYTKVLLNSCKVGTLMCVFLLLG